jgi:AhpD family alkylhydroperoxidase
MATVKLIQDKDASPEVLAVFEDIRTTRGTDFINNFWRALAADPVHLKNTWHEIKSTMSGGSIDDMVKEMVYIAVSTANGCSYCIHSHTAAAKAKGMTDEQHAELMRIIGLAGKTNNLVNAMQVPVDEVFLA